MGNKEDGRKRKPTLCVRFFQVLSSSAASSTITTLSPGGALMQGGTQQAINRTCRATFSLIKALKSELGGMLK